MYYLVMWLYIFSPGLDVLVSSNKK